ncbi:MAG: glycogen debranching enzyme family protein [Bacteroidales bacterium]|nr:glycogen debranching enzyme family protein [Bacteroidales bacterium]
MSYIEFDKEQLVNINFSKSREILRCSHTGAFANTTLVGLNTRKYHGLFIAPQDRIDHERHVLVSNLNETIIVNNMDFHLSMNQFKGGIINPKGNKYLQQFTADGIPTYLYRVGKFNFTKEIIFLKNSDRLIIKYTMLDNYDSASFQFQPLLAFRSIHQLTHANDQVNTQFESVENGVGFCLYDNYTPVYLQCSSPITYQHHPDWFYNVEYEEELNRGYEGVEDLYTPGSFTAEVKDKELFITIGTEPIKTENIAKLYTDDIKQHTSRSSFFNCLQNAADQFIVKRNGKTEVIAGYPWFGRWGRDTFIALPGLTLALGKHELCKEIMDSMIEDMNEGLFPNIGSGANAAYNSVDAPLWFFRTLQLYAQITHTEKKIWKEYGETMKRILSAYRHGTLNNIRMLDNGLIYAGGPGLALTWMDAVIDGRPVTPRTGCQVEINALWYNAVKFALEMARLAKDSDFIYDWEPMVQDFPTVFKDTFWSKEIGYLADYVNGDYKNFQIRPNMLIATSLPYSPISEKIRQLILKRTCEELLTDKGIRSLSPNDPEYKGHYFGNQAARDAAYHQGTCWIWLLFPFTDGMLAVYQKSAIPVLQRILYKFDNCMTSYGISTIAEITDGDPPHKPNGCISQAWSVAALLYMKWRIEHY